MSSNKALKHIPQYYQGTPGEVKLSALLKNRDDVTPTQHELLINSFRGTEYFTANVVDHYSTEIEEHNANKSVFVIRARRDLNIVITISSYEDECTVEPIFTEFEDIPALNLVADTIKRISIENGLSYVGMREFNNVLVYDFLQKQAKGYYTSVTVSVNKEYHNYISRGRVCSEK